MTKISQAKKFSPLVWKQELKCIKRVLKSLFLFSLLSLSPLPWWAWLGASMHVVINEERGRGDFSPF
jgi:hypothetical protein